MTRRRPHDALAGHTPLVRAYTRVDRLARRGVTPYDLRRLWEARGRLWARMSLAERDMVLSVVAMDRSRDERLARRPQ